MNVSSVKISTLMLVSISLSGCFLKDSSDSGTLTDRPFAYVERDMTTLTVSADAAIPASLDIRLPYDFAPGAKLLVADKISSAAKTTEILRTYFGNQPYDVKDLDVSVDGNKLVFAAHGPESDLKNNSWNIFTYDFQSKQLERVISDDALANAGDDTSPAFTADGHIIFSSNRQAGRVAAAGTTIADVAAKLVADPREVISSHGELIVASLLHRMSATGGDIEQITYGSHHDVKTTLMNDGMISFVRWGQKSIFLSGCTLDSDNPDFFVHPTGGGWGQSGGGSTDGGSGSVEITEEQQCQYATTIDGQATYQADIFGLYRATPSGSFSHRYYGDGSLPNETSGFVQITDPIQSADGKLVSIVRHNHNPMFGGDLLELTNAPTGTSRTEGINSLFNGNETSLTPGDVELEPGIVSVGGWYSAAWPYDDDSGRFLVGWSECIASDEGSNLPCGGVPANKLVGVKPRYGVWVINPSEGTRLPVIKARENIHISEVAVGQMNDASGSYFADIESALMEDGYAALHLHSVYDLDGIDMINQASALNVTLTSIADMADPNKNSVSERSERFMQIIARKAVPTELIYNQDSNPDGLYAYQLFGSGAGPMWDILGYSQIQPDGSVMFKVPGRDPLTSDQPIFFTFRVVNGYGKKLDSMVGESYDFSYLTTHPTELALDAGSMVECSGCHDPEGLDAVAEYSSHVDFSNPYDVANKGGTAGAAFPNTNPTLSVRKDWDTMAETLTAYQLNTRAQGDMVYRDFWAHDGNGDTPTLVNARYQDLTTTIPVNDFGCLTSWHSRCRVTINYLEHIQSIWNAPRRAIAESEGVNIANDAEVPAKYSCVGCHQKAQQEIPKLRDGGYPILEGEFEPWNGTESNHVTSYSQLFGANSYWLYDSATGWKEITPAQASETTTDPVTGDEVGVYCDDFVDPPFIENSVDENGDPVRTCYAQRLMSARGAINSANFFRMFDADPDDDMYVFDADVRSNSAQAKLNCDQNANISNNHCGWLTDSELKVIAEWLDTGAHYYNDPAKVAEDYGINLTP